MAEERPNLMKYAKSIRKDGEDWKVCMERAKKELAEKFPATGEKKETAKKSPKKTSGGKISNKSDDYKSKEDYFNRHKKK